MDKLQKPIYLLKFGTKEHMEQLKAGCLYFNPVSKYRNDGTKYRGDENEGGIPIDPMSLSIRTEDGKDWFNDLGIPRPVSVKQTFVGDDDIFMFCAAMISESVLQFQNCKYIFKDEFKNEIKQFGDYAFLFHPAELIYRLKKVQENYTPKFGFMYGSIIYRDLSNYHTDEYRNVYNMTKSVFDPFFVKSDSYKNQNEWRLIIDGSEEHLLPNNGDAFSIEIGAFDWGQVFPSNELLNGLELRNT